MSSRIQIAFPKDEPMPANIFPDFEWSGENRQALYEKYGSCVVVVYEKQVIGVGKTEAEAFADAEARLPESPEIITPITRYISNPHRSNFLIKQMMREYFARKYQNGGEE
jgi:hypothetical protein